MKNRIYAIFLQDENMLIYFDACFFKNLIFKNVCQTKHGR